MATVALHRSKAVARLAERGGARRRTAVKRRWRPVLGGEVAAKARSAIEAIALAIEPLSRRPQRKRGRASDPRRREGPSLAGGAAGLAVFYGYLSRTHPGGRFEEVALRFLREAEEAVESVTMDPSLYSGFSGVAWAMTHLEERLDAGPPYSTEAVDEALKTYVNRPGWKADYDLIIGLVGLGVYALERLPAPGAISCLEGVIDRLEETAERKTGGIAWHTNPALLPPMQRRMSPAGYYNLGLAHGVPGVIALLGAAWAAGVKRRQVRKLLDGAVAWLLRQKLQNGARSRFPAWVVPGSEPEDRRSAWCYGDPGVAVALFWAARCVGEADWEREALEIARRAATRPPEQAGVVDAGLCHGAAGLGHVFNRMYQATGDSTLAGAARFWFERTLQMRRPGEGVAGFSALLAHEDGTRYWEADPGLLMGAAGIGLALLAATTSTEPEWDRMLLVSTPDRGSRNERGTR